jgi:hypothetical protein
MPAEPDREPTAEELWRVTQGCRRCNTLRQKDRVIAYATALAFIFPEPLTMVSGFLFILI